MSSRSQKEYRGVRQVVSDAMSNVFDPNMRKFNAENKAQRAKELLGSGMARDAAEKLSGRKRRIEQALRDAGV